MSNDTFVRVGRKCQRGHNMAPRREHVLRAAELGAMAQIEADSTDKLELPNLTRAYLRLLQ
jgi:hypothetical protein